MQALEEQKEVQCILSESLENDDSNVDLEKELADLMKLDENILPSVPNTKLSSTIDELQTNLKNLHVEGKMFILYFLYCNVILVLLLMSNIMFDIIFFK